MKWRIWVWWRRRTFVTKWETITEESSIGPQVAVVCRLLWLDRGMSRLETFGGWVNISSLDDTPEIRKLVTEDLERETQKQIRRWRWGSAESVESVAI